MATFRLATQHNFYTSLSMKILLQKPNETKQIHLDVFYFSLQDYKAAFETGFNVSNAVNSS